MYNLYKSVFSNLYLSNIIFKYVREINKQIVNSGYLKNPFQPIANYQQVSFEWIIKNEEYELLKDKIKNKFKFQNITFIALKTFISNSKFSNDKEILKEFYEINKIEYIDQLYKRFDIFTISIYLQNTIFFKLVLNDLFNNKGYTNNKLKELIESVKLKPLCISLFDISLEYGNLDIIKYLYEEIGIVSNDPNKIIHYSIKSENRNQVVEYLLNKYFIETNYIQPIKYLDGIYDGYYENLLKLNPVLLKRLIEMGIPLSFSEGLLSTTLFQLSSSSSIIEINKSIDYLKSLLMFYSVVTEDCTYLIILNKVNQLIEFNDGIGNDNGGNGPIYSLYKEDLITKGQNLKYGGIKSNLLSFLNQPIESIKLGDIKIKDFNFIIEIDRIYTFDFMERVMKTRNSHYKWILKVMDFMVTYNEVGYLDSVDFKKIQYLKAIDILKVSLAHGSIEQLLMITKFNNSHFGIPLYFEIDGLIDKSKHLFNLTLYSIDHQINYLKSLITNPSLIKVSKSLLILILSHLFSTNENLKRFTNDHLNEIGNIISNWNGVSLELSSIFKFDTDDDNDDDEIVNKTIIYFYNNLSKVLFNWKTTGTFLNSIIGNSNYKLVSFYFDTIFPYYYQECINSGCIGCNACKQHILLSYCKELSFAKYLIGKYSFSFSNDSLLDLTLLNEYKSNYLWYFAFNKLIDQLPCKSILLNFENLTINQLFYINSKLKNGSLIENRLKLIKNQTDDEYISQMLVGIIDKSDGNTGDVISEIPTIFKLFTLTIYDINYIISKRNDNFIYSFIEYYKNDTINNQKLLYNIKINEDSMIKLKTSFNFNYILNLINNLQ